MDEHKFPLGIARQAIMKLDSLMIDLSEMSQEEGLDDTIVDALGTMVEMSAMMEASLLNMVSSEMGEEEFLGEN
ncbi:MAG: hypothetical protein J5614_07225, partial [Paludibacteraceae bacterium]|nr:hypothetical protein [Paludibacteraceae bacterium]